MRSICGSPSRTETNIASKSLLCMNLKLVKWNKITIDFSKWHLRLIHTWRCFSRFGCMIQFFHAVWIRKIISIWIISWISGNCALIAVSHMIWFNGHVAGILGAGIAIVISSVGVIAKSARTSDPHALDSHSMSRRPGDRWYFLLMRKIHTAQPKKWC